MNSIKARVSGIYYCYVVGYAQEGQVYSRDSKVVSLLLTGKSDAYEKPFYTKAELRGLEERIAALEGRTESTGD